MLVCTGDWKIGGSGRLATCLLKNPDFFEKNFVEVRFVGAV